MGEYVVKLDSELKIPFGRSKCMFGGLKKNNKGRLKIEFYLWDEIENKDIKYVIVFNCLIAYNSIPYESSGGLEFFRESSFNEVMDSKWINDIKKSTFDDVIVFESARHYRMMFYEEIIEVISREKPKIKRL